MISIRILKVRMNDISIVEIDGSIEKQANKNILKFVLGLPMKKDLSLLQDVRLSPRTAKDAMIAFSKKGIVDGEHCVFLAFKVAAIICMLELQRHVRLSTQKTQFFSHATSSGERHICSVEQFYAAIYSDMKLRLFDRFSEDMSVLNLTLSELFDDLVKEYPICPINTDYTNSNWTTCVECSAKIHAAIF